MILRRFLATSSAGSWRCHPLVLGDVFRWFLATSSAGPWRYFPLVLGENLSRLAEEAPLLYARSLLALGQRKVTNLDRKVGDPPLVLGDVFRWFLATSSAGSWRCLPLVPGDIFRWSLAASSAFRRFLLSRRSLRLLLSCITTVVPLWGTAERSSIRIITHDLRLTIYDMYTNVGLYTTHKNNSYMLYSSLGCLPR